MVVTRPGIERPGYRLIQGLLAEHPDWVRTRLCEERCRRGDLRNARGGSRMWPRAPGGQLAAARRDPTAHTQRPRAFDPDFGHGFVPLSNDQELPPGVVLRRTRGEALAIYHAGPEVVVRSLELQSGDEILTTDHEYGALERTWRCVCALNGAH